MSPAAAELQGTNSHNAASPLKRDLKEETEVACSSRKYTHTKNLVSFSKEDWLCVQVVVGLIKCEEIYDVLMKSEAKWSLKSYLIKV